MSSHAARSDSSLRIYLRLLGYVRPYIGIFAVSILGFIIFASSQPLLAGVMKYFVDGLADPSAALNIGWDFVDGVALMKAVPLMIVTRVGQ